MWFAEMVTERGIGNGMSLLIFTSIAATFPAAMWSIWEARGFETFLLVLIIGIVVMALVVFVEQSQRRIPVQPAHGRSAHLRRHEHVHSDQGEHGRCDPDHLRLSLLYIPMPFSSTLTDGSEPPAWVTWILTNFSTGDQPLYMAVYFLLIIGFTYFYVAITFNPVEVADNMKKYGGGFIRHPRRSSHR